MGYESEVLMQIEQETIERLLYGTGSHVHVLDALEGLAAEDAARRPEGAPHSVFQILGHMVYWQDIALARIRGEPHTAADRAADGWPRAATPAGEKGWRRTVGELAAGLRAFEEHLVEAMDPAPPDPERAALARRNVRMVMGHNAYHLGQIVILRQQLGCWPPPKGGDTW